MKRARSTLHLALGLTAACSFAACSSSLPDEPDNSSHAGNGGQSHAGSGGSTSPVAGSSSVAGTAMTGGSSGVAGSSGNSGGNHAAGAGGSATTGGAATGGGGAATGGTSSGGKGGSGGGAGSSGAPAGGAGGSGSTSPMSTGCGKAPTIASSMYNNGQHIPITAANMQREYILSVPTNYDNTKPYKLIIAYHELNGDDNEMYRNKYYHLQPLSNDTAIFVAPNGQKDGANCTSASNCGWPNPSGSDLALADAVVKQVEENFCIDTNRIFATGFSYGASMSYKTACERPLGGTNGFIRGIAIYSGSQLSGNCTPSKAVAFYGSHGTSDSVLNYDNGVGLVRNFATANSCTWATPTKVTSGNHVCTDLAGCGAQYPTKFCSFN